VLTIRLRPNLAKFGAESWLPAMVAVSIIREIGPAITALIFSGKVGSGIGAELASMNVTEQVVCVPRFFAGQRRQSANVIGNNGGVHF
jgi:phospholipid/cholesterol/gamma-HCH transport system permease protein